GVPQWSPARVLALRWAGWLEAGRGTLDGAREKWHAALAEASPPELRDSLRLAIAESWFAEGQWERVASLLRDPVTPPVYGARWELLRSRAAFELGRTDSASAGMQRLLARWPEAPDAWRNEAHTLLGWHALRRGDPAAARAHYGRIRGQPVEDLPITRYGTAVAQIQAGDFSAATETLSPGPPVAETHPVHHAWAYALAYARFQLERYDGALEALEAFRGRVSADSLSQGALSLRGDCHYRRGEMDAAYDAYAKAAAQVSDVPEALHRRMALSAIGSQRWGAAARLFGELILRFPGTRYAGEYHFWRAEAFYRLGRLSEAIRHYSQAERHEAYAARAAYALGWCEYDAGRFQAALDHFLRARTACRECPFAADLALRAGNCLFNLGRIDEAADAFATAARLAAAQQLGDLAQEAAFRLAWTDFRQARFRQAAQRFERIRQRERDTPLGARALYWEGQALFRQDRYADALERLQRVLRHAGTGDTLRARALLAVGDAHFNAGEVGEAIGWYRRVLESPGADRALARSAQESVIECRLRLGETDAAREEIERLASAFPEAEGVAERYRQIGESYFRERRYQDALAAFADFLERTPPGDPRVSEVRFDMARAREASGQTIEAARAFEALGSSAQFRRPADALLRAGRLYLQAGEPSRALTVFEQRLAFDLEPAAAARTRAHLAQAYSELEQPTAAQNEWEKVAHAGSGAPDSLRAVASLQLGRMAFAQQLWSDAAARFAAADSLGLSPQIYRTSYWAGESAFQAGDTLAAQRWLERFLEVGEREALWEATARMRLAECYEARRDTLTARAQYEAILGLDLHDSSLREESRARLQALEE
ncbi:MAG: tetratricopeptide repeat protein, partial [Candidatus Eisenbacteria bacterium]|nr:tetratricopeptide repeat protein [Candidatus Eisenbacteria bacterium]